MSKVRTPRQPSYRHHKHKGLAVVTIHGRDIYLGPYGSPDSKKAYKRLMLEWLANDGIAPPAPPHELTVTELAAAYKAHAKRYYVRDGEPTETYTHVRFVMQAFGKSPYGPTRAIDFGPLALKAYRLQMIEAGNSRRYLNDQISVIKRAFKWAASEQMIPAAVFQALQTVEGLRKGRSDAKERPPIQPVADDVVDATIAFLSPVVADMIRLLRLLGCRPTELCHMRPRSIDRSGDVWVFRPERHKTDLAGRDRTIFIGPRAQSVLSPYLLRNADDFCFSPAESDAKRRAELTAKRKTPASCGNSTGTNRRRRPRRKPGDCYDHKTLNNAVRRACDKADAAAHTANSAVPPDERLVPRWFPYQLRHACATELRKEFGLEVAQVILGHSKADVTQIYAERDATKAVAVMREVG